ncbi:acyl carrier protein [Streptococcus zalophi]|uniref:Acyl carrier protein n=1 Tax=Streptococcus zalophi TaxID=640031 RepID=A0A934PB86_9STRE|nr:acyl carrier protein [Streptococcus zalophi]MBJ8350329.1 acyl carrier protein [Streptococcus zalophi]MCR8968354.1 acyl carrier protein [Streptococcus zalophi]
MTKEDILAKMQKMIVEQLGEDDIEVTMDTNFKDDLGADSITLTEFVINVEDEFDLEILDEEVEDVRTMGQMVDYLYEKTK